MSRIPFRAIAALCLLGGALLSTACDSEVQVDGAGGASSSTTTTTSDVTATGSTQSATGSATSSGGGSTTCVLDESSVDACTLE